MINTIEANQKFNPRTVLNSKLESVTKQSEVNMGSAATSTGQLVRQDEFAIEHNNDGTHKDGIVDNAAIASNAGIYATKIANHRAYKKSTGITPSATANTYGTGIDLTLASNFAMIAPQGCDIVFGGTFNSETVTVQMTVTYNDSTTAVFTYTGNAASTRSLTNSELMNMEADGLFITKITTKAMSTIANTTATVTVNRYGYFW
jgi:hypothetical protein